MGSTDSRTDLVYLGVFGISILAALVIRDLGAAVLSFFASYGLGMILTYLVLVLPGYAGVIVATNALIQTAIVVVFVAFFPVLLLTGLVGTLLGTALSERVT